MIEHTNATTPATESQHPRTNEGACVSADIYDILFAANVERDTMNTVTKWVQALEAELAKARSTFAAELDLAVRILEHHRAALAAEQAAHALTISIYETGSKMNAAVLDSTRACITEIVDAVKAERECETACDNVVTSGDWAAASNAWMDAKAHTDAMVEKHEGAGVVDEAITAEALEREGWSRACPSPDCCWTKEMGDYGDNDLELQVQINPGDTRVFVEIGMRTREVQNVRTMNDVRQLVRLFTAPDAARARDEG